MTHGLNRFRSCELGCSGTDISFCGDGVIVDLLLKKSGNAPCIHIGGQVLPGDNPLDSVAEVQGSSNKVPTLRAHIYEHPG
jgi:hypothetical protein